MKGSNTKLFKKRFRNWTGSKKCPETGFEPVHRFELRALVMELFGVWSLSTAPVRCQMELQNHECSAPGVERSSGVDFCSGGGANLNKFLRRTRSGA